MGKVSLLKVGNGLEIERACTLAERRKILDAADRLLRIEGESKDRNRNKGEEVRPKRKGYRAFRNRAVIYCLLETGMRRAAVINLNLDDLDVEKKVLSAREKGGWFIAIRSSLRACKRSATTSRMSERQMEKLEIHRRFSWRPQLSPKLRTARSQCRKSDLESGGEARRRGREDTSFCAARNGAAYYRKDWRYCRCAKAAWS